MGTANFPAPFRAGGELRSSVRTLGGYRVANPVPRRAQGLDGEAVKPKSLNRCSIQGCCMRYIVQYGMMLLIRHIFQTIGILMAGEIGKKNRVISPVFLLPARAKVPCNHTLATPIQLQILPS